MTAFLPTVATIWESLMTFRSLALTLCLAVFCLSLIAGCAPPVNTSSPGTFQANPATTVPPTDVASPSTTVPSTDSPPLEGQALPSTTAPRTEVLDLGQ